MPKLTRRRFLQNSISALALPSLITQADTTSLIRKQIPKSSEWIPAIGMGTWITFNVGRVALLRAQRAEILRVFQEMGGRLIDSSPMYGSAEEVVGHCLDATDGHDKTFSATKTWTQSTTAGKKQFHDSLEYWRTDKLDLLQVHNLMNWKDHLKTLSRLKREGKVRYIGITTSHGRRHNELAKIMRTEEIDFVQLTYNVLDREAELQLLPLAREQGIAVIANRPFQGGNLPDLTRDKKVPEWASEIDCQTWPQLLLKFVISHPAITCAIPATSNVAHMQENMVALRGRLPDETQRQRIIEAFQG